MSMQNLAIVFGPTLFGQQHTVANGQGGAIADTTFFQNQVRLLNCQKTLNCKFSDRYLIEILPGNRNYS